MTTGHAFVAFIAAAGLLTLAPGVDTALVLRAAAVEGTRRAMLAACGICIGLLTWGLAISLGLGALLAVSRVAYNVLRIAGACYLIYLGMGMFFRKNPSLATEELSETGTSVSNKNHYAWFVRGYLTNLLNPKVGIFYVTFLPQFVPVGVPVVAFSMLLASIHAMEGILWFLVLTHATRLFSGLFRRPRVTRALDCATGTVLTGFGLELIFDRHR